MSFSQCQNNLRAAAAIALCELISENLNYAEPLNATTSSAFFPGRPDRPIRRPIDTLHPKHCQRSRGELARLRVRAEPRPSVS